MILALESSCDETAVALFDPAAGMVGEWIHSQILLHEKHGGVVPDLATREHLRNFPVLLTQAREQHGFADVSQVAVTQGPGLAACLAIGVASAKALAMALKVPVVGINHLRAHAFSPFISLHAESPVGFHAALAKLLPHLALIVSGGNTLLIEIARDRRMRVISTTRDDAAGEALDKGAKLLGLGYPGGPLVERLAVAGNAQAFDFPRGIGRRDVLDFSFSGLKTSLRYQLEKMTEADVGAKLPDLCASYQQAVIDALMRKLKFAAEQGDYASMGLSGGVANNGLLRASITRLATLQRIPLLLAAPRHTGDNAGMIAFAAWVDRTGLDTNSGLGMEINPDATPENATACQFQV
jgi:N6-L-threonylcarbamoyladenine synthase